MMCKILHIGVLQSSYMNNVVRIALNTSPEQTVRLLSLQAAFAKVCNALAALTQKTRCWNRVALHHMAYKDLRDQFPEMGSQMVCNAIYSVSRTSRLVFQHPQSPFNVGKLGEKPLPLLHFSATCPVYFDRHTLSVKPGQLSLYTLDGRLHFQLALAAEVEEGFRQKKLREIVLSRRNEGAFELAFTFSDDASDEAVPESSGSIPEYVVVEEVV
jgi:hypothetical protein